MICNGILDLYLVGLCLKHILPGVPLYLFSIAGSWRDLECRYVFRIVRLFYARDPDLQAAFPLTSADFSNSEKVEKFT